MLTLNPQVPAADLGSTAILHPSLSNKSRAGMVRIILYHSLIEVRKSQKCSYILLILGYRIISNRLNFRRVSLSLLRNFL